MIRDLHWTGPMLHMYLSYTLYGQLSPLSSCYLTVNEMGSPLFKMSSANNFKFHNCQGIAYCCRKYENTIDFLSFSLSTATIYLSWDKMWGNFSHLKLDFFSTNSKRFTCWRWTFRGNYLINNYMLNLQLEVFEKTVSSFLVVEAWVILHIIYLQVSF